LLKPLNRAARKENYMRHTTWTWITATTLLTAAVVWSQTTAQGDEREHLHYRVKDLGKVGPPGPEFITNNGLISGAAAIPDGAMHAVLWYKRLKLDIGKPGFGGPNSAAFGVNERGQAVGAAQTLDTNDEDFCGFNAYGLLPSNTTCLPFLWQNGKMSRLPTLGGANGSANRINNRGEAAGYAETKTLENACPVSQFKPVIWKNGKIHELPTFQDDTDGVAAWINDRGQVVGASGTCASSFNPNSGLYLVENHALLWEKDGKVTDLGNLGGTGGIAGNHSCAINNRGQVVGHSETSNNKTFYGFLWTEEKGMKPLGTLPGGAASLALGINDRGEVVGASLDASFVPTAYVWEDGLMTDLNTLIHGSSGLSLLLANSINDRGEIVGLGATGSGETHGFLATPCHRHGDGRECREDHDR
jgi:probable HAF family extracellular repeat protein